MKATFPALHPPGVLLVLALGKVVNITRRGQLLARGTEIRVPTRLWTASHDEIAAYLRSVFQADGYVSVRRENGNEAGRIGFAVSRALANGQHIEIRGFGTFKVKDRKSRLARNPRTGEAVPVPPRRVPVFKVSKELKDMVAQG